MNALAQRAAIAHDNLAEPIDTRGEWLDSIEEAMGDAEIAHHLACAGVDGDLLEAAVYAVRNNDFLYLKRQFERQADPVIRQAARDAAEMRGEL